ncbi:hypothetical protein L596_029230 [Steinernema carpocapsae]|uniref:LIM zinc-binding domain-containing protein n=1 Tax=Steinernema carpocapsae TaxID=34508 RepID=A0A4U5LU13_STECR|nr:hypothetical protein L596_029230 [Steinernema carpocapsae]
MDGVMDRSFDSMSSFNFSIASTGEMPPVSGQLQRLLCACYHPDKAGPRAKDEDAYAKIVKKKPDESKPGKHENSEKHVPTEVEVDEVGYAKLSIIRTPSQEAQFTSEYENNEEEDPSGRGLSNKGSEEENMTMIATVHPFNAANDRFQIEDVTDDPKYKDQYEEEEQDGSLVEYCKLDTPKKAPNVCEAARVVSARMERFRPATPAWKSSTVAHNTHMAHIIDVEVGRPCSAMATCKCHGFRPHPWRKVCVHCKCDRSDHELGPNQVINVYERLGLKPPAEMAKVIGKTRNDPPGSVAHGYAWVPPGLSRMKVEEYMSQLPNHTVPRTNSMGEKYRERQLMIQLPRQDLSVSYCKHLATQAERKVFDEFVQARNEIALDIGYVSANIQHSTECRKCKGLMERSEMAVVAPKLGENTGWHPACFTCTTCEQLLIDLTYCVRDGSIYCERHYAELHKPRCSACDEHAFFKFSSGSASPKVTLCGQTAPSPKATLMRNGFICVEPPLRVIARQEFNCGLHKGEWEPLEGSSGPPSAFDRRESTQNNRGFGAVFNKRFLSFCGPDECGQKSGSK